MIIVGKSLQQPTNPGVDYVEILLPDYRIIHRRESRFAYAWTFSPDDRAIDHLSQRPRTWLYLIGEPWLSPLRMRVIDFHHSRRPLHCPREWQRYCHPSEWCIDRFPDNPSWPPIHLWFLIDSIEGVDPPLDVRRLVPYFDDKYRMYGLNSFGFFR